MILNTDVEYIVEEIKSGKRDLFETIKQYMILADDIDNRINGVSEQLEESYGHEIVNLDNEISNLEDTIEKQDKKIEKLEYQIECLNGEIENLKLDAKEVKE